MNPKTDQAYSEDEGIIKIFKSYYLTTASFIDSQKRDNLLILILSIGKFFENRIADMAAKSRMEVVYGNCHYRG